MGRGRGGAIVVFRKENKVDAFQRQISALRQQLGTPEEGDAVELDDRREEAAYHHHDELDVPAVEPAPAHRDAGGFSFGGFGTSRAPAVEAAMPALPAPMVADAQTSVVAYDTVWKGDLQTSGSLHVHGRVEGAILAKQDVYVAEEADVDATVTASNVVIAGLVRGTVRCGNRFEVLPQGRVAGDVQAPTLVVHEGATMTGQFRMGAPESGGATVPQTVVQRRAVRGGM
jgi:cytoskeletal protein CcmA (bactofilin family)